MKKLLAVGVCAAAFACTTACTTTRPAKEQPPADTTQDVSKLGPAARTWAAQPQPAAMIDFFQGTFGTMAITLDETGEAFTVKHTGERFEFRRARSTTRTSP